MDLLELGFESFNIFTVSMIDAYVICGKVRSANDIYKRMSRVDTVSRFLHIIDYRMQRMSQLHRSHGSS